MNEELQKQLAESIKGFTETLGGAADTAKAFAQEQVPDVIHQYVMWGIINNLILFTVCITSIVGFILAFKTLGKRSDFDTGFFIILGGGLWFLPSVIGAVMTFREMVLIYIAPKVWLIQEAARLLK